MNSHRTPIFVAAALLAVALALPAGADARKFGTYSLSVDFHSRTDSKQRCEALPSGFTTKYSTSKKDYTAKARGRANIGEQQVKGKGTTQLELLLEVENNEYIEPGHTIEEPEPFEIKDGIYRWIQERKGRVNVDYESVGYTPDRVSAPIPKKGQTKTFSLNRTIHDPEEQRGDCTFEEWTDVKGTIVLKRLR